MCRIEWQRCPTERRRMPSATSSRTAGQNQSRAYDLAFFMPRLHGISETLTDQCGNYVFCCISVCLLIANNVGIEPSSGWRSMSFKNRWRWVETRKRRLGDKEATALPSIGQRVETRKRRLGDGGQCCLKASVRSHLVSNNLGVRAVGG